MNIVQAGMKHKDVYAAGWGWEQLENEMYLEGQQMATTKQVPSAPFTVVKPSTQRYLKLLIYGAPGTGKTTLAGTAQDVDEMKDVIFIDVEAGALSLAGRDDIDVVRVTSYMQFAKVYEFLKLHCQYRDVGDSDKLHDLHEKIGADPAKIYNTVVIDSLTEVQKQIMYMLLGVQIGQMNLELVPDTPEFKEWGQSAEMVRLLIRSFRDLPMHVVVVCAEAEGENERKQRIRRPNLPGKLAGEVQGPRRAALAYGRGSTRDGSTVGGRRDSHGVLVRGHLSARTVLDDRLETPIADGVEIYGD